MSKPRKINAQLMEVGQDFKVRIRGYTFSPKYPVVKELRLTRRKIRTKARELVQIFEELRQRYPNFIWKVERVQVGRRIYYKIERKKEGERSVPIYYSTTLGKVFVPKRYVTRFYRLTCSVVSYRLRDLKAQYRLTNL
jgi:hypothetical protein